MACLYVYILSGWYIKAGRCSAVTVNIAKFISLLPRIKEIADWKTRKRRNELPVTTAKVQV